MGSNIFISDTTQDRVFSDSGTGDVSIEGLLEACPTQWEVNSYSVSGRYCDTVVNIILVPTGNLSCGNFDGGKCKMNGGKCGISIKHPLEPKEIYIGGEIGNYRRVLEIHPESFKWIL